MDDRDAKRMETSLRAVFGRKQKVLKLSSYLKQQGNISFVISRRDPADYKRLLRMSFVIVEPSIMAKEFDADRDMEYSKIISPSNRQEAQSLSMLVKYIVEYCIANDISTPMKAGFVSNKEGKVESAECQNSSVSELTSLNKQSWELLFKRIGRRHICKLLLETIVFIPVKNKCGYVQLCGEYLDEFSKRQQKLQKLRIEKTRDPGLKLTEPEQKHLHLINAMRSVEVSKIAVFNLTLSSATYQKPHPIIINEDGKKVHTISTDQLSIKYLTSEDDGNKDLRLTPRCLAQLYHSVNARLLQFPFGEVLNTLCPISLNSSGKTIMGNKDGLPMRAVIDFCQTVVGRVIPFPVFGSKDNWKHVMDCVARFVRLRKYEVFPLVKAFEGLKIKDIPWLGRTDIKISRPDFFKRQRILLSVLHFIFAILLVRVIRAYLVVVEGPVNTIIYYREQVWHRVCSSEMANFKAKLEPVCPHYHIGISDPSLKNASRTSLGASRIKFLPKPGQGYRVISRLGGSAVDCPEWMSTLTEETSKQNAKKLGSIKYPSVNSRLNHVFLSLTTEAKDPAYLSARGPGVMDCFSQFPYKLASYKSSQPAASRFYSVKLDVCKAFDNIPTNLALDLARDLLSSPSYFFKLYNLLVMKNKHLYTSERTEAIPSDNPLSVSQISKIKNGGIVADKEVESVESRERLLDLLSEHLNNNLLYNDGKYYRQVVGIPQGSSLSSLLCDIVYDDFEKRHLTINPNTSMLFRYVDDFLFVSSNKMEAEDFLASMVRGFNEHGVSINPKKTVVNFTPESVAGEFTVAVYTEFVGRNINLDTLELGQDHTTSAAEYAVLYKQGPRVKISTIESKILQLSNYKLATKYIDLSLHSKGELIQSIDSCCRYLVGYLSFMLKRGSRKSFNSYRLGQFLCFISKKMAGLIATRNGQSLEHLKINTENICRKKMVKYLMKRQKLTQVAKIIENA
ncbi:hypothetical protein TRICI_004096 [Trichomonascus ciferrii]|uniref:Telomerase reverse transcriptase n=1 Tax=Trichomonascus ciferrii TaxID=44093 RepID=A0A642V6Z9_9ASCO|nr:hypothetical protein TRICI_004096 [Trichomonascus ciferrii]